MKKLKFLPALALMMVAVLTFAFRPAEKKANLSTVYYEYLGGTNFVPSDEGTAAECSGAGQICVIEFDNANVTPANAQSAALNQIDPSKSSPYTVPATGGTVTIHPKQ